MKFYVDFAPGDEHGLRLLDRLRSQGIEVVTRPELEHLDPEARQSILQKCGQFIIVVSQGYTPPSYEAELISLADERPFDTVALTQEKSNLEFLPDNLKNSLEIIVDPNFNSDSTINVLLSPARAQTIGDGVVLDEVHVPASAASTTARRQEFDRALFSKLKSFEVAPIAFEPHLANGSETPPLKNSVKSGIKNIWLDLLLIYGLIAAAVAAAYLFATQYAASLIWNVVPLAHPVPSIDEGDEFEIAAFAPLAAMPGSSFSVDVLVTPPPEKLVAMDALKLNSDTTAETSVRTFRKSVQMNDEIVITFAPVGPRGLRGRIQSRLVVWRSQPQSVRFNTQIPRAGVANESYEAELCIELNGAVIGAQSIQVRCGHPDQATTSVPSVVTSDSTFVNTLIVVGRHEEIEELPDDYFLRMSAQGVISYTDLREDPDKLDEGIDTISLEEATSKSEAILVIGDPETSHVKAEIDDIQKLARQQGQPPLKLFVVRWSDSVTSVPRALATYRPIYTSPIARDAAA
ncbi:MAG: hypothetical protein RIC14_07835 [Filomicrobium sp.]